MVINKRTALVFLFIGFVLSFFASAQSSFFIKSASSQINITSGTVQVKSATASMTQDINNINITNGTTSVKITPDTITGTVTSIQLNVRSGPGTSYEILSVLNSGQTVSIVESVSGWYKILWNGGYGYVSGNYVQTSDSTPTPPPPPPVPSGGVKSITVDAGHGGSDTGAIGYSGTYEKNVNLKVALKVRALLEAKGYTVVMTRIDDSYPSLQDRCDIANNANTDLFISIHANSIDSSSVRGIETFSYLNPSEGANFASFVQDKLVSTTGFSSRGTKTAGFYVLKYTNMPAILAELGFMSNPTEEALLNTDSVQSKCAQAIVDGIDAYANR